MSSEAQPISPARFANALQELPLENLHSTAAEIHNSLAHLASSNAQMAPFADGGDAVCRDAIAENRTVMRRMHARIGLLKAEVQRRGMPWPAELGAAEDQEPGADAGATGQPNGHALPSEIAASTSAAAGHESARAQGGGISDEELRRRVEERMREMQDDDEEGVHL